MGIFGTMDFRKQPGKKKSKIYLEGLLLVLTGYFMVMGPWFIRNLLTMGVPLAPGGSRSLWITTYDEIFLFPSNQLTLEHWLSSGLPAILKARSWALNMNLQRTIAEQGLIFLFPFILIGLWKYRGDYRIKIGIFAWFVTFLLMTIIFPYQGARGGFYHSSAAFLALIWSSAAIGFEVVLIWTHRHRNWNVPQARIVFSIAFLLITLGLTIFNLWNKFSPDSSGVASWDQNTHTYQQVDLALSDHGIDPQAIVLTGNPPGYHLVADQPAIAIPDGDVKSALEVALKFQASYLILEPDHPKGLDSLYNNPQMSPDGLKYLSSVADTHIFIME